MKCPCCGYSDGPEDKPLTQEEINCLIGDFNPKEMADNGASMEDILASLRRIMATDDADDLMAAEYPASPLQATEKE